MLFGDRYNQYLTNDRGWFDNRRDLRHLPVGEQRFTGVSYGLLDFRTSPVPSCVMLAGRGVKVPRKRKGHSFGEMSAA